MYSFLRTCISNHRYLVLTLSYLSVEAFNFGLMTASFLCAVTIDLIWIVAQPFLKHLGHSVASRVADLREQPIQDFLLASHLRILVLLEHSAPPAQIFGRTRVWSVHICDFYCLASLSLY